MIFLLVTCLLVSSVFPAPPLEQLTEEVDEQMTTVSPATDKDSTEDTTVRQTIGPIRLTGKERKALIAHLGSIDLATHKNVVLTERQQLALTQELEYQSLGFPPFSDPTPWERLTREEQQTFNSKYRALPEDIKEFSRVQFLTVPDDIKEHAFRMFLNLDIDTLTEVIGRELQKEEEQTNEIKDEVLEDLETETKEEVILTTKEKAQNDEAQVTAEDNEKLEKTKDEKTIEKDQKVIAVHKQEQTEQKKVEEEQGEAYEDKTNDILTEAVNQIKSDKQKEKNIKLKNEKSPVNASNELIFNESQLQSKEFNPKDQEAKDYLNEDETISEDTSFEYYEDEEIRIPFLPRRKIKTNEIEKIIPSSSLDEVKDEEIRTPFVPTRQRARGKYRNNIKYEARRKFVEQRKQIEVEQPRGPLNNNPGRRTRLPQSRRINLIDPRRQRQRY